MITIGRTMLRMGAVELNSQVRVTSTSYTSPTTTSTVWKNSAKGKSKMSVRGHPLALQRAENAKIRKNQLLLIILDSSTEFGYKVCTNLAKQDPGKARQNR